MMSGDNMRMASAMAVVAGRAARPCDGCGFKKARWYCAADEAYLCDACDGSVHAANALSLRHERVRLAPNGAPMKMERRNIVHSSGEQLHRVSGAPSKKKVKPRPGSQQQQQQHQYHHHQRKLPMPEVKLEFGNGGGNDMDSLDDHFTAEELTGRSNLLDDFDPDFAHVFLVSDPNDTSTHPNHHRNSHHRSHGRTVPSDGREEGEDGKQDGYGGNSRWMELEDSDYCLDLGVPRGSLAADQTGKIGAGATDVLIDSNGVKLEEGGVQNSNTQQQNFAVCKMDGLNDRDVRQVPSLRLDYADVMSSWPDRGMMWTQANGTDDSNSDVMGTGYDLGLVPDLGVSSGTLSVGAGGSGTLGEESPGLGFGNEREARVIRYREKRRNRLFSKKIRYEVRKLNAERRPRMKGRFVKRSPGRD